MATCYGGIGDTSMNNPESQVIDADIQDNYQEDLENIEPIHPAGLRHLTHKFRTIKGNY